MPLSARKTFLTPEEYLAIERAAEFKSEYYDGQMYAMSGSTRLHNLVTLNLSRRLGLQLEERACELYSMDVRVQTSEAGPYTYPDIVITCEQPRFIDGTLDTLINPQVIIEVLSPTTEKWDRGGKFDQFQRIPSLRHYVLVGQRSPIVERFDRQADDTWLEADITWPDGILTLDSVGISISIRDIYFKVFPLDHPA